jgi:hypothetical protein
LRICDLDLKVKPNLTYQVELSKRSAAALV